MASLRFTKLQGLGNDFIIIEDLAGRFDSSKLSALARRLCKRRFGIGADGLIAVGSSEDADYFMHFYNADGSGAEMCGNGIRCLGKFVADELGFDEENLWIATGAGILKLGLHRENAEVHAATVSMGVPQLSAGEIPTTLKPGSERVIGVELSIGGEILKLTAVSMGNPHVVSFVKKITDHHVLDLGPQLEHHKLFPRRANAEFVQVLTANKLRMRVWERGVGETLACGTGACASVVAAVLNGHCEMGDEIAVELNGGELQITWLAEDQPVLMTGPVATVYKGTLEL